MDAVPLTLSSEARVPTAVPRRYLGQLCKHFQHKLPVTLGEREGHIAFPAGPCDLAVSDDDTVLVLRVTAGDEAELAGLQDVVARHLLRFAFRETPEVHWVRPG